MNKSPLKNRRNLVTEGVEHALNKAAEALDLNNPLAFLGVDRTYTRLTRTSMHTDFQVLLASTEPPQMQKVGMSVLDEVDRFDTMLNIWRTGSELEKVNQTAHKEPVKISPELFAMVKLAKRYYQKTDGAFDITSTPLVKLWGFFSRNPNVPAQKDIDTTLNNVGMGHVELDSKNQTVFFKKEGIELTPASMGKGLALDHAVRVAKKQGLANLLINGGFSSVLAAGSPPWKDHWQFDIRNPLDHANSLGKIKLRDRAFSTSGAELQYLEQQGKRYGHILDPRTGWPVETMLNVCVLAPTAAEAEILSTAFYVMGVEKTLQYCENYQNIGVFILRLPDPTGKHEIITANLNNDVVEVMRESC